MYIFSELRERELYLIHVRVIIVRENSFFIVCALLKLLGERGETLPITFENSLSFADAATFSRSLVKADRIKLVKALPLAVEHSRTPRRKYLWGGGGWGWRGCVLPAATASWHSELRRSPLAHKLHIWLLTKHRKYERHVPRSQDLFESSAKLLKYVKKQKITREIIVRQN